ncbi:codanin-1 [Bombyx mandarina]|uniref:Codanin-1 n=1 Tax=Bombyx mandarina TaxID=7092 RepID=A0A6J2KDD4_BOMMA|nr:codanin-1 [Bombyx mandarina]
MPETIIESVLRGNLDVGLLVKWLNDESIEETEDCVLNCCDKNEFVSYFLAYLRNQTDSITQTNSSATQLLQHSTPEQLFSSQRKHHRSISDPTSEDRSKDSLSVKSEKHSSHESPNRDRKRGKKVKTKLFPEDRNLSISSDESKLCIGVERLVLSSTPLKNGPNHMENSNLLSPVTPRCDTPRINYKSRSHEKCLGDFMINIKSAKKKKPKEPEPKIELDLSSSEFPEIGARKASSLRSEKRRIKPTNIDKNSQKSCSFNSFTEFQRPSPMALEDNALFQPQKLQPKEASSTFDAERNILKQERHKLMEKFNILNTNLTSTQRIMPQIKVTQKEFEKSKTITMTDVSNVLFKEKIDEIVLIYEVIMKNNLILSINKEIYFLITILISKQYDEECTYAESKLRDNDFEYLLQSVHNATYFAVKSLWLNRFVLEVILDKNSLKTLGENKNVRNFYPDLAKFLLNCYGLRCEAEANQERPRAQDARPSNGVICFNSETDNADNFPSALSFQNFKKQRDMFYEALRWYGQEGAVRARARGCVAGGGGAPDNCKHLAALLLRHMLASCLPGSDGLSQESKLSKLQRRLTCPNAPDPHRLPHFTPAEMFYKEFIAHADGDSFRAHLRDALATELRALDAAHFSLDDNSNNEISKEFLKISKKLFLLAKFLGYVTSLPYTQSPEATKSNMIVKETKDYRYSVPKEKVLENDLYLRNYSQPSLDLKGMLTRSYESGRLALTLPWVVHFLSMLDYASLRTRYYQELLNLIEEINKKKLNMKKNTAVYVRSLLGWLSELPQYPGGRCGGPAVGLCAPPAGPTLDSCDLVDHSSIQELCPALRSLGALLATCRAECEQRDNSFRHITPVSLSLNHEERLRNKEKELQLRLEEEFLKSQPSSTRRVLELVIERVTSACVRELSATVLLQARERARDDARALLGASQGDDETRLVQAVRAQYAEQARRARPAALQRARRTAAARCRAALAALACRPDPTPPVRAPHRTPAAPQSTSYNAHILCKDIKAEMKLLTAPSEAAGSPGPRPAAAAAMTAADFDAVNVSPSTCIITLKEAVCQLLDGGSPGGLGGLLSACALACSPRNVFCRPPTQRAILQLSVDLCVIYVSRKPNELTDEFLNALHGVWDTCCPDRPRPPPPDLAPPPRAPDSPPDEDRAGAAGGAGPGGAADECRGLLELFDHILCPRNIVILSASPGAKPDVWGRLAAVLVYLLRNYFLSEDSLTEQCLAVYRQDWPQSTLKSLSSCMKSVSSSWCQSSTGKFTLFLDFLAEYCGDMDYEPAD